MTTPSRKTTQHLRPVAASPRTDGYDLYPAFDLPDGIISVGFDALASQLAPSLALPHRRVILDGFPGVFWEHFRAQLDAALQSHGIGVAWLDVSAALRPPDKID